MKQQQILKTLHSYLKADDIENFMVALRAIMAEHFITWNDREELREDWKRYGFDHSTVEDYFKFEVDCLAVEYKFWRFEQLCECTMDFTLVGRVKSKELIY